MTRHKGIPLALQLYTVREACEKDFFGTLRQVAEIGFNGVELAGYAGHAVQEVNRQLDGLGLEAASNHVPMTRLETELDTVIAEQKVLQCRHLVCPYVEPGDRTEKGFKDLIETLKSVVRACEKEGLIFSYHNHNFELTTLSDGRTVLDTILQDTGVMAEFDIYWLQKAGETPANWLHRYRGRTPLVHLKDMTTDGKEFFAELGTGGIDLDTILNMGQSSGVEWWIIEQDECVGDPFASVQESLRYLQGL